jgi:hypothetical protein
VSELLGKLPAKLCEMLSIGRVRQDPAVAAWEALKTMLASASQYEHGTWMIKELRGERIAYKVGGEWRIPTGTKAFKDGVGDTAVQMYGRRWVKDGLALAGKDGLTSHVKKVVDNGTVRCLVVPVAVLEGGEE